jgi:hypothetical protein
VARRVAGVERPVHTRVIPTKERKAKRILWARNSGQIIGDLLDRTVGMMKMSDVPLRRA